VPEDLHGGTPHVSGLGQPERVGPAHPPRPQPTGQLPLTDALDQLGAGRSALITRLNQPTHPDQLVQGQIRDGDIELTPFLTTQVLGEEPSA
jgi:hypothetical protein